MPLKLNGSNFKEEIAKITEEEGIKAIILGNRYRDPYSDQLKPTCASSPGWPVFTRVHPVLEWTYSEVWDFLRKFHLPYCSLYDQGYTSLGERHNSIPNPHLAVESDEGTKKFLPAYELKNGEYERESRCK